VALEAAFVTLTHVGFGKFQRGPNVISVHVTITKAHGVIGSEGSGKYDIDLGGICEQGEGHGIGESVM
jgi:hypothetical protein